MKKHWLFNCKDISRLVSDSMDRNLPLKHRLGIRFHLKMCRYCARYAKQLVRMRQEILKHTSLKKTPQCTLSGEQKRRIQEKLNRHRNSD